MSEPQKKDEQAAEETTAEETQPEAATEETAAEDAGKTAKAKPAEEAAETEAAETEAAADEPAETEATETEAAADEPAEEEAVAEAPAEEVASDEAAAAEEAADEAKAAAEAPAEPAPAEEARPPAAKVEGTAIERAAARVPTVAAEQAGPHRTRVEDLLKSGVHFGHLTRRWNPKMKPFIFMERNGIHIIDLMQTQAMLDAASDAAARFAKMGRKILFVGTKKQAKDIVKRHAESCDMPYTVERWLGGTLTNFQTIRKSIRRMEDLKKMEEDGTMEKLKKKERLMKMREREKLEKVLAGIANMARLPGAIYIVDINREHIAVKESRKLGIPIIAPIDTNCDPDLVDYPVPANDDALKSINLVTSIIAQAINEGRSARDLDEGSKQAADQEKLQEESA